MNIPSGPIIRNSEPAAAPATENFINDMNAVVNDERLSYVPAPAPLILNQEEEEEKRPAMPEIKPMLIVPLEFDSVDK